MAETYDTEVEKKQQEINEKNLELARKLASGTISEKEAAKSYIKPLSRARVSVKPGNFHKWGARFKHKSRVGGGGRGLKVNTPGNYLSHDDPVHAP